MPELYDESYSNRSFILSESRGIRPSVKGATATCPFCKKNEKLIEKTWLKYGTLENDLIRVIGNKYPVCTLDGPLYGYHDVIVDTIDHDKQPFEMSIEHWCMLMKAFRARYEALAMDSRLHMIQIFKNNGCEAGASIAHSHWQLVALEDVPASLKRQYDAEEQYYREKGSCRVCEAMAPEYEAYHIYKSEHWVVQAPLYSSIPYETCIVPKEHVSHFGALSKVQLEELGGILSKVLRGQQSALPGVHYNICFMGSVLGAFPWYHFHVRVLPRKGQFAGFELATGCYINCISALAHSAKLRDILNKLEGA